MKFTIENERITGNLTYSEIQISPNEKRGFRPYELLVSSLVGCSGTLLETILQKKRQPYEKIEVEVSSVRNPDQANRIEQISITASVHGENNIAEEQAKKIADLVVKNCGMIQSVIQSIDINFTVKSISPNGD